MKRNLDLIKTIGNELRNIRKERKLSIQEVADEAGVSKMYMSEIERDRKTPSPEVIEKLSNVYEITEKSLYNGFRKIPEDMFNALMTTSNLFSILYDIEVENILTEENKRIFYTDIEKLYNKLKNDM